MEEVSGMQSRGYASVGGRGVAGCIRMQQKRNLKQDRVNGAKDAFDPERVKSLIQKE